MNNSEKQEELFDPNNVKHDQMLGNLQGNILKGHGRNFTAHLFIRFYKNNRKEAVQWLKNFAEKVTSCKKQLKETDIFKKNGISGSVFFGFYLTGEGYSYLGEKADFLTSMKNAKLEDPDVEEWEEGYREEIHAMILIADDNYDTVQNQKQLLVKELNGFSDILKIENGNVIRNSEGEGIEHFGYADGISQPLFFREEIEAYREKYKYFQAFDPAFPLEQVLVKDPLLENENAFGSFLVFRKLEQDVKGFKKQEKQIAEKMDLKNDEVVGAVIVGRFEDGTPYALSHEDGILDNLTNNFKYGNEAGKCPFLNHIRATNERDEASRSMIMARRGIPYGAVLDIEDTGEKKRGLLFMSFQSNIKNQFEASQLRANAKKDPIIGQGSSFTAEASCFGENTENVQMDFKSFVTLKGGEYFFAPSIPYLKNLN
ncbi:Dyp-type peroxidase domain-containing protein [uncultured Chryseobacterium sp.]|uniref:Dyp-type peroxidase n=1 Tax=uncultured Chryseobacterium sp. TaxID=259322 RepID=UPI00258FD518|nr:Dyp-type peroxidase domain-containing protein [uncultured Chryseobacterium sp.]